MRVFCIGDVVGKPGLEHLRRRLPAFRRERGIDVVIANGENAATGNGISPNAAEFLLDSGVDVITTGNHAFHRKEAAEYFDTHPQVLRPANYPPGCPGQGSYLYDGGSFTLDGKDLFADMMQTRLLLESAGWTHFTALGVMLFTLMHWPCGTTLLTVKKETGSLRWTVFAILLPSVLGMAICALVNAIVNFLT